MKKTQIIVCYHKESDIFESDTLIPLHVGKDAHPEVIKHIQGDNTGDNISSKNNKYCELTGMYWLWKNVDADNYGLFHYRRLLDIKGVYKGQLDPTKIDLNDFNNAIINNEMEKYDIILPKKTKLKETLYNDYKKVHHIKDLECIVQIIKAKYPHYKKAIEKALNTKAGYFCNMFVMKKELYNEYCSWLFDILNSAENLIDTTNYNPYQKRAIGFLGERMFSIFIEYKRQTSPNLKIKEVENLFINPQPIKEIDFKIGKFIKYPTKIHFEIFNFKFSKKIVN